jgi:hypothetical protein
MSSLDPGPHRSARSAADIEIVGEAVNAGEALQPLKKISLVTRPFVLPLWTGRPWLDGCSNGEG